MYGKNIYLEVNVSGNINPEIVKSGQKNVLNSQHCSQLLSALIFGENQNRKDNVNHDLDVALGKRVQFEIAN